jgi:hypothetical protein
LDDKEDSQSGALAEAKSSTEAEPFSAVFQGKAQRIADIKDTRMHQRWEQALVEWKDRSTAWVGIHDLNSAAQQYVRLRMHGKLDSDTSVEDFASANAPDWLSSLSSNDADSASRMD